jgi:hypothetical protein
MDQTKADLRKLARIARARLRTKQSASVIELFTAAKLNANLALKCAAKSKPTITECLGAISYSTAAIHAFFQGERAIGRDPTKARLFR